MAILDEFMLGFNPEDYPAAPQKDQQEPSILDRLLAAYAGMPSWLDQATQQTKKDITNYQQGGVPALMADTGVTADLAGGFGGTTIGKMPGIRAYHGSPYDFEKFDLSRIGTGEGAQAYGHGLYFAENPQVAEAYKKALTGINPNSLGSGKGQFGVNNVPMPTGISGHAALDTGQQMDLLLSTMKHNPDSNMIPYLKQQIENRIANHYSMTSGGSAGDDMRAMAKYYNDYVKNAAPEQVTTIAPGRMYEVNINAHPDQFLDWDKPLMQHPKEIKDALLPLILPEGGQGAATGAQIYNEIAQRRVKYGNDPDWKSYPDKKRGATVLNEAGIPGIKYLDQGSRLTGGVDKLGDNYFIKGSSTPYKTRSEAESAARAAGNGTNNYVVFNPDIIDIIRKYGWAGLAAMPAATDLFQQGAQEQ